MDDIVIKVEHIRKVYKLYDKKSDRLREAMSFSKKQYYSEFYALRDISFDVKRGETLGIIGTNGSGKSTLLKILTGVVAPSGGSYTVNGKVSALLELGAGFNTEYTGLQNIDLQGVMMGYTEEEMQTRREEIIRFADIGEYINQPVKNYSSGMFARLAFAVAISIEPEVLIVDEALSVGDVFFQSKCFRKFDELREKGTSILFVSHDIPSVRKMCSRVLWIEQGEQRMFGPCDDVCTAYFNMQMHNLGEENKKILAKIKAKQEMITEENDSVLSCPRITPSSNSRLSDRVEIVSVYVKDRNGAFTNEVIADETYQIGIVTRFREDLDQVIVGFSLDNNKGITVLATNTFAINERTFSVKSGTYLETTFEFKAPRLRSGQYEICPAVALGIQDNHVNLTWLYGAFAISMVRTDYELSEYGLEYTVQNTKVKDIRLI